MNMKAIFASAFLVFGLVAADGQVIIGGGAGGGSGSVTSVATGSCLTGGPITTTGTVSGTFLINAQTGTTYTVVAGDACKLVTASNASATAWTLPQATGSFAAGFSFDVQNLGAGTVTITPATSTINGAATLALTQNQGCTITSDGTNWQVSACTAVGAAGFSSPITIPVVDSQAGAANVPAWVFSGAAFTGGTGTSTRPLVELRPASGVTAPTGFSTNGTMLGITAADAFTGTLLDMWVNSGSVFSVDKGGNINGNSAQLSQSAFFAWNGRSLILSPADGEVNFTNNAGTARAQLDFSFLKSIGTIPVVTGTGSPTIAAGSTDTMGEVTGGTSATSIVITFSTVKTNAPFCTVTAQSQIASFAYVISTSAITITETATTGSKVDYVCGQH